ncbi:alkaline phosphatase family protein [Bacteroides sp. 214]|uniref:alkaline phosphatase family protein n=1 Tax=Bacteroides sp. 214 TaxID=2302935 RepID=UPI0013D6D59C|nr:ectonucleotide pyrophosphatase/phosphodiesterase [Bacteroides sp. 214]NDW12780.1 alkaline phosphatase family protein [Bacteroides sp. 214]
MKKLILLLTLCCALQACTSQQKEPNYTVIISLDGFRWDYTDMYNTPNLDKMANMGVSARMLPSYPASTFPNHYTLATGLVPNHNGIVNNTFWDTEENTVFHMSDTTARYNPKYFLGEPIWITAQKQGVKTANFYWVGSDVRIKDMYPTYYKTWTDTPRLTFGERIEATINILTLPEEERPHLVMTYIDEPDGAGHHYGPCNKDSMNRVIYALDSLVGIAMQRITELPFANRVNLIVTSDHGMTDVSAERYINSADYLQSEWCEMVIGNRPTSIFTKEGFRDSVYNALKNVENIYVWKKEDIPAELCYGTSNRIGDIIVAPKTGWEFGNSPLTIAGAHGYFPQHPDMQVVFRAYGPDFKKNHTAGEFVNVDIYAMLAHLLKIVPEPTDGDFERIKEMFVTVP